MNVRSKEEQEFIEGFRDLLRDKGIKLSASQLGYAGSEICYTFMLTMIQTCGIAPAKELFDNLFNLAIEEQKEKS